MFLRREFQRLISAWNPVTDFFALLNEPRRPWSDPVSLKEKFVALSGDLHPDRVHNASEEVKQEAGWRYAELNSAFATLADPKNRVQHLLELERGGPPPKIKPVPSQLMEMFMQIGGLLGQVDRFLAERALVTSPMVKVQMFARGQEWADLISSRQKALNETRDHLLRKLEEMNPRWDSAPAPGAPDREAALPTNDLEEIYQVFGFITKWQNELLERMVRLAF